MPIQFHCEHCGKEITAPPGAAGRRGKCPHCGGVCYIPAATDDAESYDLAPLDEAEEARRRRDDEAAKALRDQLLHERAAVEGPDAPVARRDDDAVRPADLRAMLVEYLSAMGAGKLDAAAQSAAMLARNRKEALALIERAAADDLLAADLSRLPRPVMLGFLKQLRAKL